MKIAIIGSGISGLTCAHYLGKEHEVTLFEANNYLGGHTHTHDLKIDDREYRVDTGFIVFNKKTYPLFLEMIEELKVEYKPTPMSFSVSCEKTGLEYNGTDFNRIFAQRSNLLRPSFYSFLLGISDFNKRAKSFLEEDNDVMTLGSFFREHRIKSSVIEYYVVPMMAAVWSTDPLQVWDFPAKFVLRFFENHGFLEIDDRPQWYVIEGGSNSYIKKMMENFKGEVRLNAPVSGILREHNRVVLESKGELFYYDALVFATHSDTALKLLKDPSENEEIILSSLPYVKNPTFLHLDRSFLPQRELAWASWNYLLPPENKKGATVTYNMNILQGFKSDKLFNVTLNPHRTINKNTILKEINYDHPLFTLEGMSAQREWHQISGHNRTFYCGAYWRNGFHEDGVYSAKRVIKQIGAL